MIFLELEAVGAYRGELSSLVYRSPGSTIRGSKVYQRFVVLVPDLTFSWLHVCCATAFARRLAASPLIDDLGQPVDLPLE